MVQKEKQLCQSAEEKQPADSDEACPHFPLIGDTAPSFVAETTSGTIHFPEDYQGKWVILFSHPADFTPVCTTEFIKFAQLAETFKAMDTELIGLSVDSLSSHIAWLYTIQERVKFNGAEHIEVQFPLIADLTTQIAQKYGMIHPKANNTKTVRAVFFIDPQSKIRSILYYPASTGRNFDEIVRILTSLQVVDAFDVATPADWQPGEGVIKTSPSTVKGAVQAGLRNQDTTDAWFLSVEPLSQEDIAKKVGSRKKK